ncbi:MAG: MBL fold metallo-hydrolase [Erysipelotrichaceae bacterium]|nr:MBL fold metallo-hydrolase [Erysipelotrichaceae bacterium]
MEIETLVLGSFETNCYLLKKGNEALLIDAAGSWRRIAERVGNCELKGILLTHGHFDHIGAVDRLVREYGCPVYMSRDDAVLLDDPEINSLAGITATVKTRPVFIEGESLKIGSFDVQVLFTPGHTEGSLMFIIDGRLFSGDTLFYDGVGRTDLYSGSWAKLQQSLTVLGRLPYDMKVYPGHGPSTTVGHELSYNPYI